MLAAQGPATFSMHDVKILSIQYPALLLRYDQPLLVPGFRCEPKWLRLSFQRFLSHWHELKFARAELAQITKCLLKLHVSRRRSDLRNGCLPGSFWKSALCTDYLAADQKLFKSCWHLCL